MGFFVSFQVGGTVFGHTLGRPQNHLSFLNSTGLESCCIELQNTFTDLLFSLRWLLLYLEACAKVFILLFCSICHCWTAVMLLNTELYNFNCHIFDVNVWSQSITDQFVPFVEWLCFKYFFILPVKPLMSQYLTFLPPQFGLGRCRG